MSRLAFVALCLALSAFGTARAQANPAPRGKVRDELAKHALVPTLLIAHGFPEATVARTQRIFAKMGRVDGPGASAESSQRVMAGHSLGTTLNVESKATGATLRIDVNVNTGQAGLPSASRLSHAVTMRDHEKLPGGRSISRFITHSRPFRFREGYALEDQAFALALPDGTSSRGNKTYHLIRPDGSRQRLTAEEHESLSAGDSFVAER